MKISSGTSACALSMAAFLMLASGCGKKGPMIYGDLLVPEAPAYIKPEQTGRILKIAFPLPAKDLAGRKLRDQPLAGIKVMRLARTTSQNESCKSCLSEFRPYRKIDLEYPGEGVVILGNSMIMTDQDVEEGNTYSYIILGYLKDGTEGSPSRIVSVKLTEPPQKSGIKVSSSMGAVYVVVDTPDFFEGDGEIIGVRLFRKNLSEDGADNPIATVSPLAPKYEDRSVKPGLKYSYTGRTVFRRPDGVIAESDISAGALVTVSENP